jgi:ankyrin repeat protein
MDMPLLLATRLGQSAIVDLLVQRGAVIEAADAERKTPLHTVFELRDNKIAKILLNASANTKARILDGRELRYTMQLKRGI